MFRDFPLNSLLHAGDSSVGFSGRISEDYYLESIGNDFLYPRPRSNLAQKDPERLQPYPRLGPLFRTILRRKQARWRQGSRRRRFDTYRLEQGVVNETGLVLIETMQRLQVSDGRAF